MEHMINNENRKKSNNGFGSIHFLIHEHQKTKQLITTISNEHAKRTASILKVNLFLQD